MRTAEKAQNLIKSQEDISRVEELGKSGRRDRMKQNMEWKFVKQMNTEPMTHWVVSISSSYAIHVKHEKIHPPIQYERSNHSQRATKLKPTSCISASFNSAANITFEVNYN